MESVAMAKKNLSGSRIELLQGTLDLIILQTLRWGRGARRERELDLEIQAHLRMAQADRRARGESPEEAAAGARREFGNLGRVKEVTREMWGGLWLERVAQDLWFGVRMLWRSP